MRKQHFIMAVVLLLVVSLAVACKKQETGNGTEPETGSGTENKTEQPPEAPLAKITLFKDMYGSNIIGWSELGILTVEYLNGEKTEPYWTQNMLYFTEFHTGQKYLLCSDAYCEHEPASVKNPDPVCEATMDGIDKACIYGTKLYVIQSIGWESMVLWERDLTKKGYRKLAELPYDSMANLTAWSYQAILGTKMYLFAGKVDEEAIANGGAGSSDTETILLEVDLSTGKYKELMRFDIEGDRYTIVDTAFGKEGVYVRCNYNDTYLDEDHRPVLVEVKEKLLYIPYDGTKPTECCRELLKTLLEENDEWANLRGGFGADGFYLMTKNRDKVMLVPFDGGEKKCLYTIGEDEQEVGEVQISGNILLLGVRKKTGELEAVCINIKTGEQNRFAYGEPGEEFFSGAYRQVADGIFENMKLGQKGETYRVYDLNGLEKKVILEIEQ